MKYPLVITAESGEKLPVDVNAFLDTNFVVTNREQIDFYKNKQGYRVIERVKAEYKSFNQAPVSIAKIDYWVEDSEGQIVEIGLKNEVAVDELKAALWGREYTQKIQNQIVRTNQNLASDLLKMPEVQAKLREFEIARGWPEGFAKKLGLVYFDESLIDLKLWAQQHYVSYATMRLAGWFELRFNAYGDKVYIPRFSNTIKIPFFRDANQTEPISWRIRVLEKKTPDSPKYLSHPKDRAALDAPAVESYFYNSWKLGSARGKPVVITEGEFKSGVATEMSGVLTLGIPGITEFNASMIAKLKEAQVSEVIVILDRDPKGKALMRVDEVTDSERAAYMIAKELNDNGVGARVGTLPDVYEGGKVGIDDLILGRKEQGIQEYLKTIEDAVSPDVFAVNHSIDPKFYDLMKRRQVLRKALREYEQSASRGGYTLNIKDLNEAKADLKILEKAYSDYFQDVLHVDRRLDQPSAKYDFIPASQGYSSGLQIDPESVLKKDDFKGQLIFMDLDEKFYPADPVAQTTDIERGLALFEKAGFTPSEDEVDLAPLAGQLNYTYPSDDFGFDFDVEISKSVSGSTQSDVAPIVIYKKENHKVVAIAGFKKSDSGTLFQRFRNILRGN